MTRYPLPSSLLAVLLLACGDPPAEPGNSTTTTTGAPGTEATTTGPITTGTATTTTTTTTTTTSATPTTTDFIVAPDGGGGGGEECDVFAQNCDPGTKCAAYAARGGAAWNTTKCVPVTGDGLAGDACTVQDNPFSGLDDCALGAMCWDVAADLTGECVALCTGTSDAPICAPDFVCIIANNGALNLCLDFCDPLLQDCDGDALCIPVDGGFTCVLAAEGADVNEPCTFANDCAPGLVCLPTADASSICDPLSTGCCQPFCEFIEGMAGACPNPDQQCLSWWSHVQTPSPPGHENIGYCGVPQ